LGLFKKATCIQHFTRPNLAIRHTEAKPVIWLQQLGEERSDDSAKNNAKWGRFHPDIAQWPEGSRRDPAL